MPFVSVSLFSKIVLLRGEETHIQHLMNFATQSIHILGIESVILFSLSSSEHPKFREISALVRDR